MKIAFLGYKAWDNPDRMRFHCGFYLQYIIEVELPLLRASKESWNQYYSVLYPFSKEPTQIGLQHIKYSLYVYRYMSHTCLGSIYILLFTSQVCNIQHVVFFSILACPLFFNRVSELWNFLDSVVDFWLSFLPCISLKNGHPKTNQHITVDGWTQATQLTHTIQWYLSLPFAIKKTTKM